MIEGGSVDVYAFPYNVDGEWKEAVYRHNGECFMYQVPTLPKAKPGAAWLAGLKKKGAKAK